MGAAPYNMMPSITHIQTHTHITHEPSNTHTQTHTLNALLLSDCVCMCKNKTLLFVPNHTVINVEIKITAIA